LKFTAFELGGLEFYRQDPRKFEIRATGSLLVGEEGAGHHRPNSGEGGIGGGGGLAHEHQELKARPGVGLGGRGGDRRWVSHGGRGGGGGELVGGRLPREEGGQVLVQQLQQEERKLLGWLGRSEEGRRDELNGNRNLPARR
jgi:hypothetical protein